MLFSTKNTERETKHFSFGILIVNFIECFFVSEKHSVPHPILNFRIFLRDLIENKHVKLVFVPYFRHI